MQPQKDERHLSLDRGVANQTLPLNGNIALNNNRTMVVLQDHLDLMSEQKVRFTLDST